MKSISLVVMAVFGTLNLAWAQQIPTLDFFHGRECPHCQREKAWFPTLKQAYPDLVINEYEVWHNTENQALWSKRLADLGQTPQAVPTNIIADKVLVGFQPEAILKTLEEEYGAPAVSTEALTTPGIDNPKDYKWLLIVGAGLLLAAGAAFVGRK